MRGTDVRQSTMFSYVALESRVLAAHPLRAIRGLLDQALAALNRDFERVYPKDNPASILPERPVRALPLQILYPIRSERLIDAKVARKLLCRVVRLANLLAELRLVPT